MKIEGRLWASDFEGNSKKTDLHNDWTCVFWMSGAQEREEEKVVKKSVR